MDLGGRSAGVLRRVGSERIFGGPRHAPTRLKEIAIRPQVQHRNRSFIHFCAWARLGGAQADPIVILPSSR